MAKTYALPTFLEATTLVELLARLEHVAINNNRVVLRVAVERHEPQRYDYYGTVCETDFRGPEAAGFATVALDFWDEQTVRVRYAPGEEVPANDTPMIVGSPATGITPQVTEDAASVTVTSGRMRVVVRREPWRMELYNADGALVWATQPVDIAAFRRPERQWNPQENRWLFLHRYAYPWGRAPETGQAFASFELRHDEQIYGFGEGFGPFSKRGTEQRLWLQEAFSNASPASYKQVPFYISSRGYGLFLHTANAVLARVGSLEHTTLSLVVDDAPLLDLFVFVGPPREVIAAYTRVTGAPALPPKWSFGLWMGRISYNRQEQVEQVARELRQHEIPCDVIHIDTDWFTHDWACDLKFGPHKFPDPQAMMAHLKEQGFRVCLWQWPNLVVGTDMFQEARERGFLVQRPNGRSYTYSGFEDDAGIIDYSNPEAVAWVQAKFTALFALGASAIKADFGEGAPPDARYATQSGAAMHNLYPLLYNQAVWEATERFFGPGQAVIWARSAWAGSQRYPVHWSGDGVARYADMPCVLRSALSFGLSGFPFYSHDIGGFSGLPSPDLYVRWAQWGLFSSHARAHGVPPREPWAFGSVAEAIVRRYVELRYRLMPYIYSEAVASVAASLPLVRALLVEYNDDPVAYTLDDQYLFGRSLLVAPVLDETNRRRLYLPHGDWWEYWRKERVAGGRFLAVEADLATLPLYVRAGSVLPYAPLMQHTGQKPYDPLTLEFYAPEQRGGYTIHDEGAAPVAITYQREGGALTVMGDACPGVVELVFYGAAATRARRDGSELPVEWLDDGGLRVVLDGRRPWVVTLEQ